MEEMDVIEDNQSKKMSDTEDFEDDRGSEASEEKKEVYLPHKPLKHDEELVCDQSAYVILREVQTGKHQ